MNAAPTFDECPSMLMQPRKNPTSSKRHGPHLSHQPRASMTTECTSTMRCDDVTFPVSSSSPAGVDVLHIVESNAPRKLPFSTVCLPNDPPKHSYIAAEKKPIPFHPHCCSSACEPSIAQTRAGLRLMHNLLLAIRSTGYGSTGAHSNINHYVEDLRVDESGNAIFLKVNLNKLFQLHSLDLQPSYMRDDYDDAISQLQRRFGPVVPLRLLPVVAAQRVPQEFVDAVVGIPTRSVPVTPAGTSLHYFGDVFTGNGAPCGPADIICGFVVPDEILGVAMRKNTDALPNEPTYFEKTQCCLQWFNGTASWNTNHNRGSAPSSASPSVRPISLAIEENRLIAAYSSSLTRRTSHTVACINSLPPPQWYTPFVVRLPYHFRTAENLSTEGATVGSTVSSLQHGLRPVKLSSVSDLLDHAIVMATLRLLLSDDCA